MDHRSDDDAVKVALAARIDHTILRPDAGQAIILAACRDALACGFASVCVGSGNVAWAAAALAGGAVKTCAVVGFPLGAATPAVKAYEAAQAVADGAYEIDMVAALGALKDGRWEDCLRDIAAVREACRGALLKVIIETCLLTDDEKRMACRIAVDAGADFVKTSTGFSTHGATVADVALMAAVVGPNVGVKASGGIRTRADAMAMIAAGATRIGTSNGVALVGAHGAGTAAGSY